MVTRTPGFTTRGGQFVIDEESALIAEAMEEIISTIPELALVAPKIQANLRSLCLHTRDLAAYYAKNHPRMSGETTPETTPPMPAKIDKVFWTTRGRVLAEQGTDIPPRPYSFGRGERVPAYPVPWEPGVDYPDPVDIWPLTEMIERELNADPPLTKWPCRYSHPEGTRCPVCQDWPSLEEMNADYAAASKELAEAEVPPVDYI